MKDIKEKIVEILDWATGQRFEDNPAMFQKEVINKFLILFNQEKKEYEPIIKEFLEATPIWLKEIEKTGFNQCVMCGMRLDKMKKLLKALEDIIKEISNL